jgi:hypothetical protein
MSPNPDGSELVPVVAHGARMSWAGLLRPGDEFCRAVRSQLAVLESADERSLRRYYGAWSSRYRRFTANLSSPNVRVRVGGPDESREGGTQCILHWVNRLDMLRIDPGGPCQGDGWPVELWQSFTSELDRLAGESLGEKLAGFVTSGVKEDVPIVAEWRALLPGRVKPDGTRAAHLGQGWIPVPARLETPTRTGVCILSWSPSPMQFGSLREALESPAARREHPDLTNQARYYLECMLSRLHGISFGPSDALEDKLLEQSTSVMELKSAYYELERSRIADPAYGRLDRFR